MMSHSVDLLLFGSVRMMRFHNPLLVSLLCLAFAVSMGGAGAQTLTDTLPTLKQRIVGREFPSVFQAWNPADNLPAENSWVTLARHDLVFHAPTFFGLEWDATTIGTATGFTPASIASALARRTELLALNPHLVLLAEIRYRDAPESYLPTGSLWWKRDADGNFVMGWKEGGFIQLDFANPQFQQEVAAQAQAAVRSGVFDGVMLDWWKDDEDRLALIKKVRRAVGKDALILCNANDQTTPRTASYINGYFMECYRSETGEDWQHIAETLAWAERHLRLPRTNCLETWYHVSREDLNLMRATTALALTASNGYCLFSDPNPLPTPDHLHNWYPFWDKSLGAPRTGGKKQSDGTIRREFAQGTVVYNPLGNAPCRIRFRTERRSLATGITARTHILNAPDGDIFLPPTK